MISSFQNGLILRMLPAMRATHFIEFVAVRTHGPAAARTPDRSFRLHGNGTPLDLQDLSMDEDIGDFPARRFDDSAEGLPRYVHPGGRLLLVQPFQISQADRLIFVEGQENFISG
jgi:hypothetical protein